jgi:hypothetical protein
MKALAAALVIVLLPASAAAHDPYREWRAPAGHSCCHNADCGVWDAEDVQPIRDGGFRVISIGVDVPRDRILPSPDGRTHVCCVREGGAVGSGPCKRWANGTYTVRCIAVPMGM